MRRKLEYVIDIHGMTENEGYCAILEKLNSLPQGAKKLLVIHGYHGGQVLKTMVRNFMHYKIDSILPSFANDGETTFYLK